MRLDPQQQAPPAVWVLSEESPFVDPEESGGCICGVYASPAAALFELGTSDIGEEGLAQITWYQMHAEAYEGVGYGQALYFLQRYTVQDEATLRTNLAALEATYGGRPSPYHAWSTEDLLRLLTHHQPCEEDATDEP